jgi:hypothetical protein
LHFDSLDQNILYFDSLILKYFAFDHPSIKSFHFVQDILHFDVPDQNPVPLVRFLGVGFLQRRR